MTSSPLFTSVAEFVVTTRPMSQVGCASASAGVTSASSERRRPRNGPPDAVSTSRRTSSSVPDRSACAIAECSESTGTICPGRASRVTRSPPTMSDSLLASARVVPRSRAARVGASPTDPVMPLSTTSASTSVTSCTASSMPTAVCSTWNSAACSASSARFEPTARPTTSKRRGFARMTSRACVPIEPEEPRMMTLRTSQLYGRNRPVRGSSIGPRRFGGRPCSAPISRGRRPTRRGCRGPARRGTGCRASRARTRGRCARRGRHRRHRRGPRPRASTVR